MDADTVDLRLGEFTGDLDLLLRALDAAALEEAVLEVDGDADELHAFVEERVRDDPELREHNLSARPGRWRGVCPVRWRWGGAAPLRDSDRERESAPASRVKLFGVGPAMGFQV